MGSLPRLNVQDVINKENIESEIANSNNICQFNNQVSAK